jgi:hypothetical protein
MLWNDNWGWAWTALIITMTSFWLVVVWNLATTERDSRATPRHRAAVGRVGQHRGDPCQPVRPERLQPRTTPPS